ncbi:hypothetical protein SAMN05421644_12719 [Allochromatium warmingii]|uniref:Uncharacterized protein n=1 Tax=Allochromatium warmingii TaxID=61595 RepID=A0A1H3GWL2_ALLWA|nr:hypothetical protein [Allochromatium warmingii]SDY06739.1 hypothetical protein SAMN05421644_12719 [Allochromatium warmingii]
MSLLSKLKPTRAMLIVGAASLLTAVPVSQAFDFGNMMNPNRWFGGDRDRYDERQDDPYWGGPPIPLGPYGGYGYPGVYGAPYAMPYGVPVPAPAVQPPAQSQAQPNVDPNEVEALKRRIEELEARQQRPSPPQSAPAEWPTAPPAFRPMNQY